MPGEEGSIVWREPEGMKGDALELRENSAEGGRIKWEMFPEIPEEPYKLCRYREGQVVKVKKKSESDERGRRGIEPCKCEPLGEKKTVGSSETG